MASSVDLLVLYAYWWGSGVDGRAALMCCRTSLSRHFMITGVNATVITEGCSGSLLWNWYYRGRFQAGGDSAL